MAYTGWQPASAPGRYMRSRFPDVRFLKLRFPGPWVPTWTLPDGTPLLSGPIQQLSNYPLLVAGGGNPSTVGVTFGERLRMHYVDLEPSWLDGPTSGRRYALGRTRDEPDPVWNDLISEANELARELRAIEGDQVDDPRQHRMSRLCGVLALYQAADVMRVRSGELGSHPICSIPSTAPVDLLLDHVDEPLVTAVSLMMFHAAARLPQPPSLRNPRAEVRMGGAAGRADLLLDELLLEVKVVARIRITAEYAYQVLDYLLGSTEDVTEVGWYFARHAVLWSFPVKEFLTTLAGGPVTLPQARAEYNDVF